MTWIVWQWQTINVKKLWLYFQIFKYPSMITITLWEYSANNFFAKIDCDKLLKSVVISDSETNKTLEVARIKDSEYRTILDTEL